MKKPENSNTSSNSDDKVGAGVRDSGKKAAAKSGVVAATDIPSGTGQKPPKGGGKVRADTSTVIGDKSEGLPVAPRKDSEKPLPLTNATSKPADMPKPATETAKPAAAAPAVTVQKNGFWPVVLGGVVAAGLGAGATLWALPHLPAGWLPDAPIDTAALRDEAVAAARAEAEAAADDRVATLRQELQAIAPAEGGGGAGLAALQQRLDEQSAAIEELRGAAQIDPQVIERVQALAAQAGALEQQIQTAAQQAQTQITAAQAEAEKLQQAAEGSTRRAEAVAAIAALQTALDRGVTPDEARQTLEGAGIDTPEALAREVPSLDSLQAGFPAAARAALRSTLRDDSASGNGSLFTNFLKAQTGARSVIPRDGDDADAVLSRADADVTAGRIGAALDQMAALPDAAKAAPDMAAWLDGATAYRDAQAALSDLSATTN